MRAVIIYEKKRLLIGHLLEKDGGAVCTIDYFTKQVFPDVPQ